jgi:glycosyltransferase involved in cell wall biosynthesis
MLRMRVLISINSCWNIYNFRAGLIRELVRNGYEVVAAAPPDDYSSRLEQLGCRYLALPMDGNGQSPIQDILLFFRYLRLLRKVRPDVFLGYTIKPNIFGSVAAHLLGIPVINNIPGLGVAFARETWLTKLVKLLYSFALGPSKTVFFQNAESRDLFIRLKLVRTQQALLLPGSGVDLQKFKPQKNTPQPGGPAETVFLLLGRLFWDKGVGEYVEAARLVKQCFPEARFQILGFLDGAARGAISRSQMDAWVKEGIVEYLGSAEDVRPAIAAANCAVLPSRYPEGTPRALLEAAAMARPIVTTDMPGCRATVDDGVSGFLCMPRNAEDLAEKLIAFLCLAPEARERMGAASRIKAERKYDERIVVRRYVAAIEQAAGGLGSSTAAELRVLEAGDSGAVGYAQSRDGK